jgi:ABC-type dipeptide/oligopeptide/nickel transport system ATPase component
LARRCVSIAGESGAGKSTVALELAARLPDATVLHQDDYFHLPPDENASRRRKDLTWVGRGEVDLELLATHVSAFKRGDAQFADVATLIVEGTYVTRLPELDLRVFIDRDYRATEVDRRARGRDPIDEHTDRILAIEHELIRTDLPLADLVLSR